MVHTCVEMSAVHRLIPFTRTARNSMAKPFGERWICTLRGGYCGLVPCRTGSRPIDKGEDETRDKFTLTRGFWMGVYPVTEGQWSAVKGDGSFTSHRAMENESWNNCQEFVLMLQQRDGIHYRLPTEAEWDYVSRAGITMRFYLGNLTTRDEAKVFMALEAGMPVGCYPPNAFDLHDIHGVGW
ncbi:MAG: SUMF1/EgtB/PvdO family nonheme iron enzyme [Gemmataceae bacterium]